MLFFSQKNGLNTLQAKFLSKYLSGSRNRFKVLSFVPDFKAFTFTLIFIQVLLFLLLFLNLFCVSLT